MPGCLNISIKEMNFQECMAQGYNKVFHLILAREEGSQFSKIIGTELHLMRNTDRLMASLMCHLTPTSALATLCLMSNLIFKMLRD